MLGMHHKEYISHSGNLISTIYRDTDDDGSVTR